LASLRRTAIANLSVDDAVTLEALQQLDAVSRDARLLPVDFLLQGWARVELTAPQAERFRHGQSLTLFGLQSDGVCRVYGDSRFIGVAEYRSGLLLVPLRLVAES
jgi:tRNA pseudouridine55 synthase